MMSISPPAGQQRFGGTVRFGCGIIQCAGQIEQKEGFGSIALTSNRPNCCQNLSCAMC